MTCLFLEMIEWYEGVEKIETAHPNELDHFFSIILIFCFTWGMGGAFYDDMTEQGRSNFNAVIK